MGRGGGAMGWRWRVAGGEGVIEWDVTRIARGAGATVVSAGTGSPAGPHAACVDSRSLQRGDLFVALIGERVDGGAFAAQALRAGAWGVLVAPEHAGSALKDPAGGAVLVHPDPLAGLQSLARAWRRDLSPPARGGARVVGVTGSTGKTSTKDILAAVLAQRLRTVSSPENLNTEIGLPLAILAAPRDTEALVLEMAMRGPGQIAELTAIAEPDVGVIVNVGPVHLEQLGSVEGVAAAKAELIAGMRPGATVVIPVGEPLLEPHVRADQRTVRFGEGGEVELVERGADGVVRIALGEGGEVVVRPSFEQSHNLRNLLAAVAAARALGVTPEGPLEVEFSALRGERIALADNIVLINDCYNANPISMRAALDDLAQSAPGRRVAVLGDMLELGPQERALHREIGAHARARGVDLLVTVGPLAAEMDMDLDGSVCRVPDVGAAVAKLPDLLRAGDTVLVKGSRGVGLEVVAQALMSMHPQRGTGD
jgi:UDP-N-acetylmuramoyl-tripeptide--D-alanyl-D-alanine ligase